MESRLDVLATLGRSYLFEGLPRTTVAPLAAAVRARVLARDESLWRPGDSADELFVVASGEIKHFVLDIDGHELVHLLHGPGQTLGEPGYFSVERQRSVGSCAVTSAVVLRIGRRELDPFLEEHPSVKDRALEGLAALVRWYGGVMASNVRQPLADRVAHRLLDLVDATTRGQSSAAATPPISQSTLAAMTGVSRENLNRALASLINAGTIRREGSTYVIDDETALRQHVNRDWPVTSLRDRRSTPDGS